LAARSVFHATDAAFTALLPTALLPVPPLPFMLNCALLLLATLVCCASCTSRQAALAEVQPRTGMSRAMVLAHYGKPLATVRHKDGSEEWTYSFRTEGPAEITHHQTEVITRDQQTFSAGRTWASGSATQGAVLFLTPAGVVRSPIPPGRIVTD
jgi:hypothetical protein